MAAFRKPFAPGDVVWGPDAFHDDDPLLQAGAMRPWLVVSNEQFPGHGEQYLCCALTTGSTRGAAFVPLDPAKDWERGGTPKRSSIDTETVITMKQRWIADYSGRVTFPRLAEARKKLRSYL